MPQDYRRSQPARRQGPIRSSSQSRGSNRSTGRSAGGAATDRNPPQSELELALTAALEAPASTATTFAALGLPATLVTVLARRGIDAPFAIQARTLPDALAGRDVLGRAQTGSGKTLAFGLPLLARLAGPRAAGADTLPRGLVLVPTRELARQVADALAPLGQPLGVRVTTVYGGAPIGRQIDQLRRGTDVVVATPGRLIDLMERRACSLEAIEMTVLDEADHMADLGFMPAVTRILDATPAGGQRLLFSATLDRGIDRLVRAYLNDPALHAIASAAAPVESVDHRVYTVRSEDKLAVTAEIVARPGRTLLFVRTKHGADRLAKQLRREGVEAGAIHGDLKQNARQRALEGFTAGSPRVLVATDVAARGIHVDDVDLVVHFDPPADHKDYLHRSGRTARAGNTGTVLALVQPEQARGFARLHEAARVSAVTTRVHPGHEAVRELATSGTPIVPVPVVPAAARPSSSPGAGRDGGQGHRGGRRLHPSHAGAGRRHTSARPGGRTTSPSGQGSDRA